MDLAHESNEMFLDAWEALGNDSPGWEKRRGGLVEVSWCGYANPFFNLAVIARTPGLMAEFEAAVRETAEWAGSRKLPYMLAACHQTLGDLKEEAESLLEGLGFTPMMRLTGMETSELTPPSRPLPDGKWLTEADTSIGDRITRLNEAAYGMSMGEPGSLGFEHFEWWGAPARMATVLAPGGEPLSCAAVLGVGSVRYVALVATQPSAQRKGYAEAAMRDVLERSRAAGLGARTYLHATEAGRPVYERMGYRATADYTLYFKS